MTIFLPGYLIYLYIHNQHNLEAQNHKYAQSKLTPRMLLFKLRTGTGLY